ncbi:MAG: NAD(P)H-quinone oxidoreductase [Proteobacteria bacterium]|nr:NAD(P)H-quinone oxidoreductase [Pseudomonadota bacterium]MDA1311352.1 NAD(P)H-quinone oxidoreductase [Pseudomonadota bacterium]
MSDLPATMTAIEIEAFGPPEGLKAASRPMPTPSDGEVLVRVSHAGVNRPDVQQRLGGYPPPPGASDIPGLEIAGTIVALGPNAGDWKIGDETCALVSGGGYAEYCTAPAPQCLPIPKGFTLEQAASVVETSYTVWANVFMRGHLKAGETFLVHGGSSGIGTMAIQLAKAFGARVFATAGSAEKCKVCEDLGAERAINYRDEDFVAVMKQSGRADVILDMVGGPYIQRNLDCLNIEGRLCQIAFLQPPVVEKFNFLKMLTLRLTLTGSTLRPRTVAQKAEIAGALKAKVWPLLESGAVKPVLFKTFPMAEAASAHALMESSRHIGKIMLDCRG